MKYEWRWVKRLEGGEPYPALLLAEKDIRSFIGIIQKDENGYFPVVLNKERTFHLVTQERMSLDEAKIAVEKYAIDNDIIPDGATLEDYMDERGTP